MKLIFCPNCQDVLKFDYKSRQCKCGRSGGKYLEDGLHAEIYGLTIPLGLANSTLVKALDNRPEDGMGKKFTAFVIPKECPTIKKVED